ncbi:hypothetical protein RUM43_005129 [Polyplax serrata]|uniref:Histone-lysine N-methyltransferase eggless n=1 Tax=Polyplax serrata TaxID=468196 RepID=A0AAN8SCL9_POLSC
MQSEVETKSDSEDEEIMCLEPSLKKIQKLNISQTSVHGTSEINNKFSDVPQTEVINLDDYSGSNASLNSRINETDRAQTLGKTLINRRCPTRISNEIKENNCGAESCDVEQNIVNTYTQEGMEDKTEKLQNNLHDSEKKDLNALIDNQVQCINLHCQSGVDLAEAPVFALTYFGVARRKNVYQKVCQQCFQIALRHQEKMCNLLKIQMPVMAIDFPRQKDDVVVMDSVEEIYEEEILPQSIISMVEEQLVELVEEAVNKYNVDYQLEVAQNMLTKKLDDLEKTKGDIESEINAIDDRLKKARTLIYKAFTPRIKSIQALSISDRTDKNIEELTRKHGTKSVEEVIKECTTPATKNPVEVDNSNVEMHDVVALKEVELPKVNLPPLGKLSYPSLCLGSQVYTIKASVFGIWVMGKIVEIVSKIDDGTTSYRVRLDSAQRGANTKVVTGKQLAYRTPSRVMYPVGTRVIALFKNAEALGKSAYYAGVIAEPPKILNAYRYLVFFDDGYAQYVYHNKILLVCDCSRHVYEDVHSDSRDFIKSYLDQYPERPMVKLQQGQVVKTEWNGKWWTARVIKVDGSLAKMHFDADNRTEWIYRGSTRLGPLYSELVAAAARKEQGALSRHRSLGIASLKKRNMPYVEYSFDQDDTKSNLPVVSKNVAKKSTTSRINIQNELERQLSHARSNEKTEYTSKGYIRKMDLTGRIQGRSFIPHQCGPSCVSWTKYSRPSCRPINLLAIPIFYGFERQIAWSKTKKTVLYRAPCGRRLRNLVEMHRYLRITKCEMGLDHFDFDNWVCVLDEFHLEPNMYWTHVKDISYGYENIPVSCVNEINHSWPSFMDYSTSRIPQEGVNICFDEEFLVCCTCTDDCQDKEKCECWQLTIEGTKLGPGGQADPTVGYCNKRLLEPVTTGIYECNQRCKCGPTCLNRVAQHPLQLNLQVFRTLRKGWGLRTLNDIPQGGFICIYAGRLHTEQSANDDGRMYGDEYLAELDYIEVVERFKEGYESEVVEPEGDKESWNNHNEEDSDDCQDEQDELDESQMSNDDTDYVPQGLTKLPKTSNVVNTRGRNKKIEEKSESEGEKDKDDEVEGDKETLNGDDDDEEMNKKPSKFTADVPVEQQKEPKYKSVREMFGDGADDCYIMDAKSSGNIGRYLNHSCQPNVFVQNVFVDTHDVRFPWVAFFALTFIKAGTELTWDYNYDVGSVPDKDFIESNGPFIGIPFEYKIEDEKFIEEASKFTDLMRTSNLDICQHKVILQIKTSCFSMTEEELAKMSVNLLNCQSQVDERKLFPCTNSMTLRDCTKDMDANMWNAYHLMNNRARAVCLVARRSQFQALSEMTVNKLMATAHDQIKKMTGLLEGQEKLEELTQGTLESVEKGHATLIEQQNTLKDSQNKIQDFMKFNLEQLTSEKALIAAGNKELIKMTQVIKEKLDEATVQLDSQTQTATQNHKDLLRDIEALQLQARDIFKRIDSSMEKLLAQQELASQGYISAVENLLKINETIHYVKLVITTIRNEIDEKFFWIKNFLNGTGNHLEKLISVTIHIIYLLIAMLFASFLNFSVMSRILLAIVVPLNSLVMYNHGPEVAMDFSQITLLLTTAVVWLNQLLRFVFGWIGSSSTSSSPSRERDGDFISGSLRHDGNENLDDWNGSSSLQDRSLQSVDSRVNDWLQLKVSYSRKGSPSSRVGPHCPLCLKEKGRIAGSGHTLLT